MVHASRRNKTGRPETADVPSLLEVQSSYCNTGAQRAGFLTFDISVFIASDNISDATDTEVFFWPAGQKRSYRASVGAAASISMLIFSVDFAPRILIRKRWTIMLLW